MIREQLRAFVIGQVNWPESGGALTNDYPLLGNNVLDSLGIFEIVSYVESEFGVEISDEELVPENFGTIDDIARLTESKQPA